MLYHRIFWPQQFRRAFHGSVEVCRVDGIVVEGPSDSPFGYNRQRQGYIESARAYGEWIPGTPGRNIPACDASLIWRMAELAQNAIPPDTAVVAACRGENKSRLGALLHGPGSQAALCGFEESLDPRSEGNQRYWIGRRSYCDPKAFMAARLWFRQFQWNVDNLVKRKVQRRRTLCADQRRPAAGMC